MDRFRAALCLFSLTLAGTGRAEQQAPLTIESLTAEVTITRDSWGVPHVDGKTDAACAFGLAYAQAEDYFWQVEDTYISCLGRAAEIYGKKSLNTDLLVRSFEIVPRSQADFPKLEPELQRLFTAFSMGLNHYLARHPETKPRMIARFEPWHVLAYCRGLSVEIGSGRLIIGRRYRPEDAETIYQHVGSNAWAIAPSRTKSKRAMLFCNPHQPWYGFGQFYECHCRSGEGWNFTGATFFGHPLPSLGHNEHLGWTFTSSDPNIGSAWIETFDHPTDKLKYRYADGYRDATEWKETVVIREGSKTEKREYTFRKTHHGPVLSRRNDKEYVAANLSKLHEAILSRMLLRLFRATNFEQFRAAMGMLEFPSFNCVYADRGGNIFYVYNAAIPRRDPSFDWTKPVDGKDPRTEWQGLHPIDELPQCLNPPSGFVQNCNNTPATTTDDGNPSLLDFPQYMVMEKHDDKRRSKMSRLILRELSDATHEDVVKAAFDTRVYWAMTEFPRFKREFDRMKTRAPELHAQAKPYFDHLLDWNCEGTADSTQMTLCHAWYEELYGMGYPAETLKTRFAVEPDQKFAALVKAAEGLKSMHGDWKVKWADVHRSQRHANVSDFFKIPFSDRLPSLPLLGAPGPMGVIFTQYYTPSIYVPLLRETRKRYGVVGPTYMSVIEFTDRIKAGTLIQYGSSSRPDSPHFFDQARLVSERRLKPELFYWDDVEKDAKLVYRPGEEGRAVAAGK